MGQEVDVLIIGGGPNGISCAIEALEHGLSYVVLERSSLFSSLRQLSQEMLFLSPPKRCQLGKFEFSCERFRPFVGEVLDYFLKVVDYYQLSVIQQCEVTEVEKLEQGFLAKVANGEKIKAQKVILSLGYQDVANLIGVTGEELPHVSHYYDGSRNVLFGEQIVVVGAQASALEAVLDLHKKGAAVSLVHRGEGFRAPLKPWLWACGEDKIKKGEVKGYFHSTVKRISKQNVTIYSGADNLEMQLPASRVFLMTGYCPNLTLLKSCGADCDLENSKPRERN